MRFASGVFGYLVAYQWGSALSLTSIPISATAQSQGN